MSYNREQVQLPTETSNPYGPERTQRTPLLLSVATAVGRLASASFKMTSGARGSHPAHSGTTKNLKECQSERRALLSGLDDFFQEQESIDGGRIAITALYIFTNTLDAAGRSSMHELSIEFFREGGGADSCPKESRGDYMRQIPAMTARQQLYRQYAEADKRELERSHMQWGCQSPGLYVPCSQHIQGVYAQLGQSYRESSFYGDAEAEEAMAYDWARAALIEYRDTKYPLRMPCVSFLEINAQDGQP